MALELQMNCATGQLTEVPAPVPAMVVPQSVTMRQARHALLAAGLLSTVDATIAALPDGAREAAEIDWNCAVEVRRDNALVAGMAQALGLSAETIDALFLAAAAIE